MQSRFVRKIKVSKEKTALKIRHSMVRTKKPRKLKATKPSPPYTIEEHNDLVIYRICGDINHDEDWEGSVARLICFSPEKVTCVLNRHGETEIIVDPTHSRDPSRLLLWKNVTDNLYNLPTSVVDRNMQRRAARADPLYLVDNFKDHRFSRYLENPKIRSRIRRLAPGKAPVEITNNVKVHMPSRYSLSITVKGKDPTTIHMPVKVQNIHRLHRYTDVLVGADRIIGQMMLKDPNKTHVNVQLMDTERAGSRSNDPGTNHESVISNCFSTVNKNPNRFGSGGSGGPNVGGPNVGGPSKLLEFHLNHLIRMQVPPNCAVFANFGIMHGSFATKNRSTVDNTIGLHRDNEDNNYKFGGKQYGLMIRSDGQNRPGFPSSMCWLFYYSQKNEKIRSLDEDQIRLCPHLTRHGYEKYVLGK